MSHPSRSERVAMHSGDYVTAHDRKSLKRVAKLVEKMRIPAKAHIVDFGCGNAMLLACIQKFDITRYVGVDFSPDFIASARQRHPSTNAEFVCSSIVDFAIAHEQQFDVGFAFDLAEHVPDDEWRDIVTAMYLSLREGGTLYLHTPNAEFFVERMKSANFILKQFPEHIAVRDPAANATFFAEAGFDPVSITILSHYNVLKLLHPLSHFPIIGPLFSARIFIEAVKTHGGGLANRG